MVVVLATYWVAFIFEVVFNVWAVDDDVFGDELVECGDEGLFGDGFHRLGGNLWYGFAGGVLVKNGVWEVRHSEEGTWLGSDWYPLRLCFGVTHLLKHQRLIVMAWFVRLHWIIASFSLAAVAQHIVRSNFHAYCQRWEKTLGAYQMSVADSIVDPGSLRSSDPHMCALKYLGERRPHQEVLKGLCVLLFEEVTVKLLSTLHHR
jgi:hypothetical protein